MKCPACGMEYDDKMDFCACCGEEKEPNMEEYEIEASLVEAQIAEEEEILRLADEYQPECPEDAPYEGEEPPLEMS